ncbi:MAG: uroporphyrinogen decarboxylase [Betaproteobacteria bacterium]
MAQFKASPELLNDRFLKACRFEKTDRTPIWLMRQAGRYLPEYNATRSKAGSFLALAKNPQFAAEVTMQPLDRFELDAAILFSDILTIPDAMGLGLNFVQGEGPQFSKPLNTEKRILDLQVADMGQLTYVFDAVKEIRKALITNGKQRVPLIGFSGSPWTLACYMIEGAGSKDFYQTKSLMFKRPDLIQRVLDINIDSISEYLLQQIFSGAQAAMLFDTWGGLLSNEDYIKYSLLPMQKIIKRIKAHPEVPKDLPVMLFTKGGSSWLADMAGVGADVIGLDWSNSLGKSREQLNQLNKKIAIQGNLDPLVLLSDPKTIQNKAISLLEELALTSNKNEGLSSLDGHIFNLGHGISQFTPPENVQALIEQVIKTSTLLRKT